jgi:eukaryotic-like serine/threonine-protein kinase
MTGKDGVSLLYVPAGPFIMGSKAEDARAACLEYHSFCGVDGFEDEEPQHEVNLAAFWIDETEVTNAMYAQCVQDGPCNQNMGRSYTHDSYFGNPEFDSFPVVFVSWNDAKTYCEWADRRLPTEAEWEKVARGENGFLYPWGNDPPNKDLLNYNYFVGDTIQVSTYRNGASPYGALDMAGNVWEWVSSIYKPYPYDPTDGREDPASQEDRVMRGGSWSNFQGGVVHSAVRHSFETTATYWDIGFRCAMDATP